MPAGLGLRTRTSTRSTSNRSTTESATADASASSRWNARPSDTCRTHSATVAVVDGVLDAVRGRRARDLDPHVVEKRLAFLALVLEDAVLAEDLQAVQLDRDHPTAAATVSASTCSRTSWTRKIAAPRS